MPELSPSIVAAAAPLLPLGLIFALAGLVKGVIGLGLPTVAMALLALLMPPAEAATLLIVPSLLTNLLQLGPWRSLPALARHLAPMQFGIVGGTLGGACLLGAPAGSWATLGLGGALLAYAAWGLAAPHFTLAAASGRRLALPAGVLTGLITAATGVFVIPAVPYLQALGLRRDELIQAMGLSFTVSTLALAAGLYGNGGGAGLGLGNSALMLLPAIGGMQAGQWLRRRLAPAMFRRCFLGGLALLGTHLLLRAALGS